MPRLLNPWRLISRRLFAMSVALACVGRTQATSKPGMDAYDYIVVGSGPGGATVARYLSENSGHSVLLLESGEDKDQLEIIKDSSFAPTLEERVAQLFYSVPQIPNDISNADDAYIQGE